MEASFSAVIYARDFNPNTADLNRDNWTGPAIEAVTEALEGRAVAIQVDRSTGFTVVGATLHGVRGDKVLVIDSCTPQGTLYSIRDIGMILPLEDHARQDTKYTALEIFRKRQSAAIAAAGKHMEERDGRNYGSMKAVGDMGNNSFTVTYEPCDNPPADRKAGSRYAIRARQSKGTGAWHLAVISDYTDLDKRRAEREARQAGRTAQAAG
ncbi:hypothetical protein ABZT26_36165 [Streptomyces sp. NPDC005395]|uniref:hypothetical protein n=1 Tax=Streptomyces sp. NPDC005395 TaxID=3157042 RepID=UPI0033A0C0E0